MKIYLSHNDNTTTLRFGEDHSPSIYLYPKEMAPLASYDDKLLNDGYHKAIVTPLKLVLFDLQTPSDDAVVQTPIHIFHMDVNRFFKTVLLLREKFEKDKADWVAAGKKEWLFKHYSDILELDRFRWKSQPTPMMTITQLLRHKNVKEPSALVKTIALFHKGLSPDNWRKFMSRLCSYVNVAYLYGQGEELYFDGRRGEGLCGYNGAMILRLDEQDFSIHT